MKFNLSNRRYIFLVALLTSLMITAVYFGNPKNTGFIPDNTNWKGTIILATIHKDGISIGSDSRSVMTEANENNRVFAYYEESPKLFEFQQYIIGNAGLMNFKRFTFAGLVRQFAVKYTQPLPIDKVHNEFTNFSRQYLTPDELILFKANDMFVCGYSGGLPYICHYRGKEKTIINQGYRSSDPPDNNVQAVSNQFKSSFKAEADELIVKYLNNAIKRYGQKDTAVMGGPLSLANIDKSGVHWKQKHSKNTFNTIEEIACALKKGKLKMWFRSKEYEAFRKAKMYEQIKICK